MKKGFKKKRRHKTWQLQEAKAKFSKLVNEALEDGYQTITRNGHPVVVVISQDEFEQYRKPQDTLIDFFMEAPFPEIELDTQRDQDPGREIDL
jgi:antitoxin Phd